MLVLAAPAALLPAAIVHRLAKRVRAEAIKRGCPSDGLILYALIEGLGLKPCFAFFHALRYTGLNVIPSRTHFCLLEVRDAHHIRQQLLTRKILVRDGTSFGLPQFVRVATRPTGEWQQLLLALQEIV